jgi:Domain of unknown function (DUF4198)
MKRHVLAAVLFAAAATPAAAYTSYLKPERFWVTEPQVEVEGSYTTTFFTPAIAVGDNLTLLNSSGERIPADRVAVTPSGATELQADLHRGGTYRVSTGEVLGQVANLVGDNGQWRVLGASETPPEGAQTTTLQTVTVADTYVTRGTASDVSQLPTVGRLAIRPITHPNQVLASQGLQIELLFDGQPLPNVAIVLYRAGDQESDLDTYVATDASGRATFTFDTAGQYIIAARHRADMAPGSAAAVGSYTTTLTFEALDQLHAETEVQEVTAEPEPERRTRTPARRRVGRPDT